MGKRETDVDMNNRLMSRRDLLCCWGLGVREDFLKKETLALSFEG